MRSLAQFTLQLYRALGVVNQRARSSVREWLGGHALLTPDRRVADGIWGVTGLLDIFSAQGGWTRFSRMGQSEQPDPRSITATRGVLPEC